MKNIMLVGFVSLLSFTACKKENSESNTSLSDQKIEYQTRQLEIERQKLAIEQERLVYQKQKSADSISEVKAKKAAVVVEKVQPVRTRTVYVDNTPRSSSSNSGSGNSNSGTSAPVAQKKGMSSAAKGTIIGTVGGAAVGAIVAKKNRGLGAVIGGVAGGATGYTIGRAKDRKTGRVQPR